MPYRYVDNCSRKGDTSGHLGHPCHLCGKLWHSHNDHKCRDGRDGWFEDEVDPNIVAASAPGAELYDPIKQRSSFQYGALVGYHPVSTDVCHRCHKPWTAHCGYQCLGDGGHGYFGPQPDPMRSTTSLATTPAKQAEALGGATNMVINVIATRKVTKVDSATGEQTVVERLVVSADIIAADANSAILIAGRKIATELSDEDLSVGVTVKATTK